MGNENPLSVELSRGFVVGEIEDVIIIILHGNPRIIIWKENCSGMLSINLVMNEDRARENLRNNKNNNILLHFHIYNK